MAKIALMFGLTLGVAAQVVVLIVYGAIVCQIAANENKRVGILWLGLQFQGYILLDPYTKYFLFFRLIH